jgi:hypothetical protein
MKPAKADQGGDLMTAAGIHVLAKEHDNGENIVSAMPIANPHISENTPAVFSA